jgi:hypothetical protein
VRESLEERDVKEEEELTEEEETIAEKEVKEGKKMIVITETTEIIEIEKIALSEEIITEMIGQEMREDGSVMKIANMKIEEIEETTTIIMKIKLKPDTVMIEMKEEKTIRAVILLLT